MRERIRDRERLEHILRAIDELLAGRNRFSPDEAESNPIIYFGFVKLVEIIGEAVYKLSLEFKQAHPEVEWGTIESMRHVLVHGYYQIKPEQLWDTLNYDLPQLRPFIAKYIEEETASH